MVERVVFFFSFPSGKYFVFRFDERRAHVFHEVIDENPDSPGSRQPAGGVVRLENESHFFQSRHVVSDGRRRNPHVVFFQEGFRSGNFPGFQVLFDDDLQDVDFSEIDLFHWIREPFGHAANCIGNAIEVKRGERRETEEKRRGT